MDNFNNVLTTFLGLECVSYIGVYAGSESSRISLNYLNLSSEYERRSHGFGMSWHEDWVINDRICIFGWTIPLSQDVFWNRAPVIVTSMKCLKEPHQYYSEDYVSPFYHTDVLMGDQAFHSSYIPSPPISRGLAV